MSTQGTLYGSSCVGSDSNSSSESCGSECAQERCHRGCYFKYCGVRCPNEEVCPFLHNLTDAEAGEFVMWKTNCHHILYASDQSSVSSASSQIGNSEDKIRVNRLRKQFSNLRMVSGVFETQLNSPGPDGRPLREYIPRDGNGHLTSTGSSLHTSGTCVPCGFLFSLGGCTNGVLCRHCHFAHKGRRQRKHKRRNTDVGR